MRLRKYSSSLRGACFLARTGCLYKINRPSRLRRAIGFDLSYLLTSKASPDNRGIIIIIISEVESGLHGGGIIAQV